MTATHNDQRKENQPMKPATILLHALIVLSVALAALASPRDIRADVVTDWNEITLATQASIPGGIRTPPAARALAMVHLAIFDSVNAIDRRFTPYLVESLADPGASPEAAAVAAAHTVLVALYPSRQANLDLAYDMSLAAIPDGSAKTEGIDVGESVAAESQQNSLADNARLFALLNLAGVDTTIAVMDTKYTFNFWRPRDAIRAGDTDGNELTIADPTWTPLTYIGVHPDYVSQHAAYGQAAATVLARFFKTDDIPFSITTSTAP